MNTVANEQFVVEVVIATRTNDELARARAAAASVGVAECERHSPNSWSPFRVPLGKAAELLAAAQAAGLKTDSTIRPRGWYVYDSVDRSGTFGWGGEGWCYSFGDGRWKSLIWRAGCHPNMPWHGIVVDGDWEPYYGDMERIYYRGEECPSSAREWAQEQGLPVTVATAVT